MKKHKNGCCCLVVKIKLVCGMPFYILPVDLCKWALGRCPLLFTAQSVQGFCYIFDRWPFLYVFIEYAFITLR